MILLNIFVSLNLSKLDILQEIHIIVIIELKQMEQKMVIGGTKEQNEKAQKTIDMLMSFSIKKLEDYYKKYPNKDDLFSFLLSETIKWKKDSSKARRYFNKITKQKEQKC